MRNEHFSLFDDIKTNKALLSAYRLIFKKRKRERSCEQAERETEIEREIECGDAVNERIKRFLIVSQQLHSK